MAEQSIYDLVPARLWWQLVPFCSCLCQLALGVPLIVCNYSLAVREWQSETAAEVEGVSDSGELWYQRIDRGDNRAGVNTMRGICCKRRESAWASNNYVSLIRTTNKENKDWGKWEPTGQQEQQQLQLLYNDWRRSLTSETGASTSSGSTHQSSLSQEWLQGLENLHSSLFYSSLA